MTFEKEYINSSGLYEDEGQMWADQENDTDILENKGIENDCMSL